MTLADLLHSLTLAGLTPRLGDGELLEVAGDLAGLTPELRQGLLEHRAALTSMLHPPCFILPPGLADAIRFFDRLARDMDRLNATAGETLALEPSPSPTPCECGSSATFLALIHKGESLRRDCAKCGRFREFPSWWNREKTEEIFRRALSESGYNTPAPEKRIAEERKLLGDSDACPF